MEPDLNRFTLRCSYPYLHGVYLAVNAIPDVHLLIDGPLCAFSKAEQIFGTHDLMSTLLTTTTLHRVVHTQLHVDNIVDGNKDQFLSVFRRLIEAPFVKAIFTTSFPMASIIGSPYENWFDEIETDHDKFVICIPGDSLQADWLEGYSTTLRVMAEHLPLPTVTPDPKKVAIVGYFMDRNEEDHHGNIRELRRLLGEMSLDLASVWLGGEGIDSLARVAEAGVILAFPHAAPAAEILATRTGAKVVRCELPFGPDATARWLRNVGEACGRSLEAERLIETEISACSRRLKWLILKRLVHGRWAFAGDPWLMPGLCEIARFVGARIQLLVSWTCRETVWVHDIDWPVPVLHDQYAGRLAEILAEKENDIDLVIGNHGLAEDCDMIPNRMGFMEFGFPNLRHHAIFDEPFLGYRGFLCFINRVANCFSDLDLGPDAEEGIDSL